MVSDVVLVLRLLLFELFLELILCPPMLVRRCTGE